jgi:hypothetical protein
LNVIRINEIEHKAKSQVPETSTCQDELATEKLTSHKSPVMDQIRAELINAESKRITHEIHKLSSIWNVEKLSVD